MKRCLLPLAAVLLLGGCATFTPAELSQVRSRGVSQDVVAKLEGGHALSPAEVIELSRRRVPETWIVRQLEDHGVDSLVTKDDVAKLKKAGVHPAVIDAVLRASDDFADEYRYRNAGDFDDYYGSPLYGYYDPWYWYGGVGLSYAYPLRHGHHEHHGSHHRRH